MLSQPHAQPHHDGSPVYVSAAAPELGEQVQVRVRIPHSFGEVVSVRARSNPDREQRYSAARLTETADGADWWQAGLIVENPVHGYRFVIELADGTLRWLNARGLSRVETPDVDDFRLLAHPPAPEWAASTVMYQIFPDRFARSAEAEHRQLPDWAEPAAWTDEPIHVGHSTPRQFYGGDLVGIAEHLDHLERLGATMLYLTPIFPARSNHRYDAHSFDEVDPLLGGDEALVALVEAAHERGIRVLGDLTSNHSGDAHEWFRAAHGHPEAAESDFYLWLDDEHQDYVSWLGHSTLPKFNWASAELRRRFIEGPDSVVATWLKPPYSLDGWRIDVANMTGRYRDQDLNAEVRQIIRRTMLEVNPDTLLIGESTNDAAPDFTGDAWHGAMTYPSFTRPVWNWLSEPGSPAQGGINFPLGRTEPYTGGDFYAAHRGFTAAFPWRVRLHNMNALDTHDTPRFRTHALPGAVPIAFGLAVTLPGIPLVFAGDEFGLTGLDGEHSRSPIPWDDVDGAASYIDEFAALIGLRRANPALNGGGIRWLHVSDEVLIFVRESAQQSVLVLAARSALQVELPAGVVGGDPVSAFDGEFGIVDAERGADGALLFTAPGPAFAAWTLPGVTARWH